MWSHSQSLYPWGVASGSRRRRIIPSLKTVVAGVLCLSIPALALLQGGATAEGRASSQFLALAVFALVILADRAAPPWRRVRGPLIVLLGFAVLAFLQSVPLPVALTGALAPERVSLTHDAVVQAGGVAPASVPISLTPGISWRVGLELLCLATALVAAAFAFGRRVHRRWLVGFVLGTAMIQVILGTGPLLAKQVPRLLGSFANPDHVAIPLEMGTAICLAAIAWMAMSRRWAGAGEQRLVGIVILGAVLTLLLLGLALTGSRAGLLACAVGVLVEMVLLLRRPKLRRPVLVASALLLLAVAFLAWVGPDRTFGRMLGTTRYDVTATGRFIVWGEALPLLGVSPWLGVGMGAFRESFTLVQETGISKVTWARAHNDYLELMISGGLLGAAALLAGGAWTVRDLLARLRFARGSEERLFVLGTLGALASVAVHEALDFGLTLPANALLLVVLVGAALGSGRIRADRAS